MYFAKQIIDVDLTEIIQHLITLYFDHNYVNIYKILKMKYEPENEPSIDERRYRLNDIPVNKYYKSGMVFIKDENPVIIQRVKIDEETNFLLNTLLMITSNIINESEIINIIIENWIKGSFVKKKFEVENIFTVGKCSRFSIEVGQSSWNSLLKMCKNNRISIKNGFKMSIKQYFNEIYCNINNIIVVK